MLGGTRTVMSARMLRTLLFVLLVTAVACGDGPQKGKPGNSNAGRSSVSAPRGSAEEREETTLYGVDVVDAQTAFAWGINDKDFIGGLVLKTSDGGAHWSCVLRADQLELVGLDFVDAQNGAAISDGGVLFTTTDGGATWKASNQVDLFTPKHSIATPDTAAAQQVYEEIDGIAFSGEKNGWAFGARQESKPGNKPNRLSVVTIPIVLRTTDGGATWKETKVADSFPDVTLKRAKFVDAQNGWITGGDIDEDEVGVAYRTTDGGTTWKDVTPNNKQVPSDVSFLDATHGWLVGTIADESGESGVSEVFTTTDGGAAWKSIAKIPASIRGMQFVDAQTGWAVGANGKIFRTTDGGVTWVEQATQDWTGGQVSDITDPQYPKGSAAPTYTGFILLAPGHGWAVSDRGIDELKAK